MQVFMDVIFYDEDDANDDYDDQADDDDDKNNERQESKVLKCLERLNVVFPLFNSTKPAIRRIFTNLREFKILICKLNNFRT